MRSTPPDRRHRGSASWLVSLVGREVAQQVGGPIEPLGPEPGLGEALRSGLHEHAVYERLIGGRRHAAEGERHWTETQLEQDRKSTRLNSSHYCATRMPSSA